MARSSSVAAALGFAALRCQAARDDPPVRPDLLLTFEATLWTNQSAQGSISYEVSSPVAFDATLMAIAQQSTNADGRVAKAVTLLGPGGIANKTSGQWALQHFFNWTVCYTYPVPSIGPPSYYIAENYFQALEQLIDMRLEEYDHTKYDGVGHVDGRECDRWTTADPRFPDTGSWFCVDRDTGALLSANHSSSSQMAQNVFHNHSTTPDASHFDIPSKGCVDLRAMPDPEAMHEAVNDPERIAQINREAVGQWIAAPNAVFDGGVTVEEASARNGLANDGLWGARPLPLASQEHRAALAALDLPAEFDARTAWPSCEPLKRIRDQGKCGSCWAFSATEVLQDRYCIAGPSSEATKNLTLSPEYILDCDDVDLGCGGGLLDDAWWFLAEHGLPTETCVPYQKFRGDMPIPCSAIQKCVAGATEDFTVHKASSAYAVAGPGDAQGMQREILAHGPIQVGFQVFSDFHSYRSGVYSRTPSATGPSGGHAVKILGWGTENGLDYWLVANSYGVGFGLEGFFKIRRGTNECGIEQTPAAGLVSLESFPGAIVV